MDSSDRVVSVKAFWDNNRIVSYLPTTRQRFGTSSVTATVGCHVSQLALPVTV
jgi:hypothetical protein